MDGANPKGKDHGGLKALFLVKKGSSHIKKKKGGAVG